MAINTLSDLQSPNPFWWKEGKKTLHQDLFGIVKSIEDNQAHLTQANLRHLRLYGNLEVLGMGIYSYYRANQSTDDRLKLNICKAVADTLAAKISKNKPKPTFITSGGSFEEQRKAKRLDQAVNALFYQDNVYTKAQQIFLDAAVMGTGIAKINSQSGQPSMERVIPDEIKIDNADGYYGAPRCVYHVKTYNREVLYEMFPDDKKAISTVASETGNNALFNSLQLTDQIKVIEAWHLPSRIPENPEEKTDGQHVITISNAVLRQEEWRKPFFPLCFFKLNPKILGPWASGVCEELAPIQLELNKLLIVLQQTLELCRTKVLVENSSEIVDSQLNNGVGMIVTYSGIKPEYWAGGSVPPELAAQINWLYQRAFEQFGISQLSSTSQKPAGLNAGVALREYNDIETERFVLIGQRWEQFFVDLARQFVSCAKDIYAEDDQYAIKTIKDNHRVKYLEDIKWSEVDLADKDYKIEIFPTSSLPSRPEARKQSVQEMIQAGMISPEDGLRLLDFPDLKEYLSLANAPTEEIDMLIGEILENSRYTSPEPFENLEFGIRRFQSAYLRAKIDQAPEPKLELLRRWMVEAEQLLAKAQQPANPMPEMAMDPMANPEPPPTSDLIPNVNLPLQ